MISIDISKALKQIGIVATFVMLFNAKFVDAQGSPNEQTNSVLKKLDFTRDRILRERR